MATVKIYQNKFEVTKIGNAIFSQFHFYHGGAPYPKNPSTGKDTVSPGLYSKTKYVGSAGSWFIDGGTGTLLQSNEWFILHANVCKRRA